MVVSGGAWAAFERHLGRLIGYAVVIEVGYALLSIGVQYSVLQYAMLVPRVISLSVWALGLSVLQMHSKDLDFRSVQGIGRQFPLASSAIFFANLSLAGMPLLAGFPVLLVLWNQLAAITPSMSLLSFLGSVGLLIGCLRSLAVLIMGPQNIPWNQREDLTQRIYLFIGIVCLFILGIFPQWFYPLFSGLVVPRLLSP